MNSHSVQHNQIDIFAQPEEVDIFDTSSAAQEVDIFAAPEVDIFASDAEVDIFAAPEVDIFAAPEVDIFDTSEQQIDIFGTTQEEPVSIWSNQGNSQVSGNADPLINKFDDLLQSLNNENLQGISNVVNSAKNLYTNGVGR